MVAKNEFCLRKQLLIEARKGVKVFCIKNTTRLRREKAKIKGGDFFDETAWQAKWDGAQTFTPSCGRHISLQ